MKVVITLRDVIGLMFLGISGLILLSVFIYVGIKKFIDKIKRKFKK